MKFTGKLKKLALATALTGSLMAHRGCYTAGSVYVDNFPRPVYVQPYNQVFVQPPVFVHPPVFVNPPYYWNQPFCPPPVRFFPPVPRYYHR